MGNIKQLVVYYIKKYETSDPFKIAKELQIEVACGDIGNRAGCYMYLKKHKCIFLNENLSEHEGRFVMAHELGHAIMTPKLNCYFIRNKTLLLNSWYEIDANKFAIELLLPDEVMDEYAELGYSIEQISKISGYHQKLIELKLK